MKTDMKCPKCVTVMDEKVSKFPGEKTYLCPSCECIVIIDENEAYSIQKEGGVITSVSVYGKSAVFTSNNNIIIERIYSPDSDGD